MARVLKQRLAEIARLTIEIVQSPEPIMTNSLIDKLITLRNEVEEAIDYVERSLEREK